MTCNGRIFPATKFIPANEMDMSDNIAWHVVVLCFFPLKSFFSQVEALVKIEIGFAGTLFGHEGTSPFGTRFIPN